MPPQFYTESMFLCLSWDAASVYVPTTASSIKESAQQQWGDPGWLWLGFFAHLTLTVRVKKRLKQKLFREASLSMAVFTKLYTEAAPLMCIDASWRTSLGSSFSHTTECWILSLKRLSVYSPSFKLIRCNFCLAYLLQGVVFLLFDNGFINMFTKENKL